MRFRRVPLAQAHGHILGHNVSREGRRVLKKGRRVTALELRELEASGVDSVYVAELDPSDVGEDAAAERIGMALARASGLDLELAHGGRVSLRAQRQGVISVRASLLLELNSIPGVTLATRPNHAVAGAGELAATLKIIPFALPADKVAAAAELAGRGLITFRSLEAKRVHLLVIGSVGRRERLIEAYRRPLEARLAELGSQDVRLEYVPQDRQAEERLARAIAAQGEGGTDLLIVVGETATMDADDLIPRAIRAAGGTVSVVGAPVFPGNLLLLGSLGPCSILGAPGCARSRAPNVVDLLLPRLLTGERPGAREIAELGLGGMLGQPRATGEQGGASEPPEGAVGRGGADD